ncbi:MAG TPA: DUF4388 domain-containing protein [Ktedonobacterales bacterium]|jgi:hypothetical protein|nr:DUF4388 domain-containing protein [Ktedonobacterales bacterium]HEX5572520.1 DUF4388 domain-containing protein [Ktedonobacterales bacterium]
MPLMGNLRQFALPNVLHAIESGQRTGRLRLAYSGLEGAIYFSGGQLLLVERAGQNFALAQQFLRARLISPEQLENATGLPAEKAQTLPDVQAVRALISARVLTQSQLRSWAEDDAVTLLGSAFAWPEGDFLFEDGVLIPAGRVAMPLPVGPLIEQAQRRLRDSNIRNPPPLAPEMIVDFAEVDPAGESVTVSREQWSLLTQIDGASSLIAISQRMAQPELTIMRLASQLTVAGVLVVVGRA